MGFHGFSFFSTEFIKIPDRAGFSEEPAGLNEDRAWFSEDRAGFSEDRAGLNEDRAGFFVEPAAISFCTQNNNSGDDNAIFHAQSVCCNEFSSCL